MVIFVLFLVTVGGFYEGEIHSEDDISTTTISPLNMFYYGNDRLLYARTPDSKSQHEWENYESKQWLELSEKHKDEDRNEKAFSEMKAVELLEGLIKHHNDISQQGHYFTRSDAERMSRVTERIVDILSELEELDNGIKNEDILSRLGHLHELHPELVNAAVEGTHRDYLHQLADQGLFKNSDGRFIGEYYGELEEQRKQDSDDIADGMIRPEITTVTATTTQETTKSILTEAAEGAAHIGQVLVEEVSDINGEVVHHEPDHTNVPYGLAHEVIVSHPTSRTLRETIVEESDLISENEPTTRSGGVVLMAIIGALIGYCVQKVKCYYERRSLQLKHDMSSDLLDDL